MGDYLLTRGHCWLTVGIFQGYGSFSLGFEKICHWNFVERAVCEFDEVRCRDS